MSDKHWKVAKEALFAVIIIVGFWLIINQLLKQPDNHFEFGNLMDFFNALGTLGTLLVAYLAYKNAPKWLHQKKNEDSYNLVKELILDDYYNLNSNWKRICTSAIYLERNLELVSIYLSDHTSTEDCNLNLEKIRDRSLTPDLITHKLSKLTKLNCSLKPEVLVHHENIMKTSKNVFKEYMLIWTSVKIIITRNFIDEEYHERINDLKESIGKLNTELNSMNLSYKNIEDYSDDLSDYFSLKDVRKI